MSKLKLILVNLFLLLFLAGCANTPVSITDLESLKGVDGRVEISQKTGVVDIKPTWGFNIFRDERTVNGTGAFLTETNGELHLNTGSTGQGFVNLRTKERGEYVPGSIADIGIGLRINETLTGNQEVTWGYFDELNGFGFGQNTTCTFVFFLDDGNRNATCQENWNIDTLDGTDNKDNPSGLNFNVSDGHIFNMKFQWYGYGTIRYFMNIENENGLKKELEVHRTNVNGETSILDPNQPLTINADNNGTNDDINVFVGGRQMSFIDGRSESDQLPVYESISGYTFNDPVGTWVPLISMKLKDTFGTSNRTNSVRVQLDALQMSTEDNVEFRATVNSRTNRSNPFVGVDNWGNQSAVEVKTVTRTGDIDIIEEGYPILPGILTSNKGSDRSDVERQSNFILGTDEEIIMWAKNTQSTNNEISAIIEWQEQR